MNEFIQMLTDTCPCGERHTHENHYCWICRSIGFRHLENECPQTCPCEHADQHARDTHQCHICLTVGYNHNEDACPARCLCSPNDIHSLQTHFCRFCKKVGYTHSETECLMKCRCGMGRVTHSVTDHEYHVDKVIGYTSDDCPCPCLTKCVADDYVRNSRVHSKRRHYCYFCQRKGFTHDIDECPMECRCDKYKYRHTVSEHQPMINSFKPSNSTVNLS
jgi:hypothetical protein